MHARRVRRNGRPRGRWVECEVSARASALRVATALLGALVMPVHTQATDSPGPGAPVIQASIRISAALQSLSLSDGDLCPAFAPATTAYTATVADDVTETTVSATAAGAGTVTVQPSDADLVAEGHQVSLSRGDNEITITVDETGLAQRTYTIDVKRALLIGSAAQRIEYDLGTGLANLVRPCEVVIGDFHASVRLKDETDAIDSSDYATRTVQTSGNETKIIHTDSRYPQMTQVFKADSKNIKTYLVIEDATDALSTNHMVPIKLKEGARVRMGLGGVGSNRVLKMPSFQPNGARWRFTTERDTSLRSYNVTAFYENESRKGLIVGAITHKNWRTAIYLTLGSQGSGPLTELTVTSGVAAERDVMEHGYLSGNEISSATIMMGVYDDFRLGLEDYAEEVQRIQPKLASAPELQAWDNTTFSWKTWGKGSKRRALTYANVLEVLDFTEKLKDQGFANKGGHAVVALAAHYWDIFTEEQWLTFADECVARGLLPGWYMQPWLLLDAADLDDPIYEDATYTFRDITTKDSNGDPLGIVRPEGTKYALDPTHPGTRARIDKQMDWAIEKGFKWLRMDFTYFGSLEGVYHDSGITTGIQAYNSGMKYITDKAGGKIHINLAISPYFPHNTGHSRRISGDVYHSISDVEYELNALAGGWWLGNGVLYEYLDPGVVDFHPTRNDAEMSRTKVNSAAITGMLQADDNWNKARFRGLAREYYLNSDVLALIGKARSFMPVELASGRGAPESFVHHEDGSDGGTTYFAVFNYSTNAATKTIKADRFIPDDWNDPQYEYVFYELWDKTTTIRKPGATWDLQLPARGSKIYKIARQATAVVAVTGLSELALSGIDIGTFAAGTTSYAATVANDVASTQVTATPNDADASVTITDANGSTAGASRTVALATGPNAITVTVTAENGTTATYTVTVTREAAETALTAGFERVPDGHDGSSRFELRVRFSEELAEGSGRKVASALSISGATRDYVLRVGNKRDFFKFTLTPSGDGDVTVSLNAPSGCGESDSVCTSDGRALSEAVEVTIQGPSTEPVPEPLTASFSGMPSEHDGETAFTFTVTFSEEPQVSAATLRDGAIVVTGGSVRAANRRTPGSDLSWNVTVEPDGNDDVAIELPATTDCAAAAAICTADDRPLSNTSSARVTREAMSTDATLSSLTLSGIDIGTFAAATTSYTATVAHDVASTQVAATANDAGASVTIADADGSTDGTSRTVTLAEGSNTITVTVTAEDGETTANYTVTVTREAASTDATLSSLALSGIDIGTFAAGTTAYTASVGNDVASTQVTATANDAGASVTIADGDGSTDGTSRNVSLAEGTNTITVTVTAEDAETTANYTVTVTREAASTDATLSSLALSGIDIGTFAAGTTAYTASVDNDAASTQVTATANDAGASVTISDADGSTDGTSRNVSLDEGTNTITVTVTAEDGETTTNYTVTVTREAASTDATLSSLALSGIDIGTFAAGTTAYTASVGNDVASTQVTAVANDAGASVTISDADGSTDGTSRNVSLAEGSNTITVTVTAEDGETTANYTVTVTREAAETALAAGFERVPDGHDGSSPFELRVRFTEELAEHSGRKVAQALSVSGGTPGTVLRVGVTRDLFKFQLTPSGNGDVTVSLNAPSGCGESDSVCTTDGRALSNAPSVTVEGPDAASTDATLSALTLTRVDIGTFAAGTTSYSASVGNAVAGTQVTATPNHSGASVTIADADGSTDGTSRTVALAEGSNAITVTVTAEDGETTANYTVTVTREAAETALTARFRNAPKGGHDGWSPFELRVRFSEELAEGSRRKVAEALSVSGGTRGNLLRVGAARDLFRFQLTPSGIGDVTVSLNAPSGCGESDSVCTTDGRALSNTPSVTVNGPAAVNASANGPVVTLQWDSPRDGFGSPSGTDYGVRVNGHARAVVSAALTGSTARLTLQSPVAAGDTVTVAYLGSAMHPLAEATGQVRSGPWDGVVAENRTGIEPLAAPAAIVDWRPADPLAAAAEDTVRLDASGLGLSEVWGVERLTALQRLDLSGNAIADLSPLAGLGNLKDLDLSGNRVTDLWPLSGLYNLERLNLSDTGVTDVQALAWLPNLKVLLLDGNEVSDAWPLAGLGTLENLGLGGNRIGEVTALQDLQQLRRLDLSGNPAADISPLGDIGSLLWLALPGDRAGASVEALGQLTRLGWVWSESVESAGDDVTIPRRVRRPGEAR